MPLQLGMIARVRALSQGRSCLIRQILVTTTLDRYLSHVQSDQAQYIRANRCPFADVDLTSAHRPEREGRSHPSVRNDLIIYPERTGPALSLPGLSPGGPSRAQSWRAFPASVLAGLPGLSPGGPSRAQSWRAFPGSVLAGQQEHGDLPGGLGLVFAESGMSGDQPRPQPRSGGVVQLPRQDRERLRAQLGPDHRVGLEVVVPVGVTRRSSVGGDDREAAVSQDEAAQRRDALDPGPGSEVMDENHRGARPLPAEASFVRPELLDDLGVVLAGARSRVRHDLLQCVPESGVRAEPAWLAAEIDQPAALQSSRASEPLREPAGTRIVRTTGTAAYSAREHRRRPGQSQGGKMPDRILTSHAGSLPRPEDLIALNEQRAEGDLSDEAGYLRKLRAAVADVVKRQRDVGIDLVNDGEYGHSMGQRYDYGPWWTYVFQRLGGLELTEDVLLDIPQAKAKPGEIVLASFAERRDWLAFADAYGDPTSGVALPNRPAAPVCRGPITYQGQDDVQRDIADMKAAMEAAGVSDGFLNSVAPGSCARFGNEYYADDDEIMQACADAMREEYTAIIDAGLILQLDDPAIAENWDQINPAPTVADYQRFIMTRVEALNHAIRGLPPERIRFHLCWGSWHGPHTTDIPMADIVDVMLAIKAGMYSFEAANVRHEHEWKIWRDVKLTDGKRILPGVVSHSTNVVEHPELVADRICRYAEAVGRENVVASTDCGLGGRVHPQIAWAKLDSLAKGAELASRQLWG